VGGLAFRAHKRLDFAPGQSVHAEGPNGTSEPRAEVKPQLASRRGLWW
jgi:hypothetical protein